ncbi:hypothetical protein Q6D67_02255 [Haliea sp. E1-2-M8]|uniref:hypothetical protein n=1 Tax=Haliea sp. E1-2-M8 TaxID=3064706 RepID=UPI00271D548E|nr:hypothetical protein [Haliea sp. E1-2-M8]MDO8860508.1 hypothetical protein [Haliea sp. E1-2-M8]
MSATGRHIAGAFLLGAVIAVGPAQAQLPLSIEELLVEQRTFKLQTAFTYSNSGDAGAAIFRSGEGGASAWQQPQLRASTVTSRVRYGMRRNLEVNASVTQAQIDWRGPAASGGDEQYALALGANWLLSADNHTPAVMLTGAVDVLETSWLQPGVRHHGRTTRLGVHIYRAIDPVVLSLAVSHEWRLSRDFAGGRLNPGDVLTMRPQVNFAVNRRVTLTGGISWQRSAGDRFDGTTLARSRHQTGLSLGLGLLASPRSTVFVDSHVFTSGDSGASLSLEWLYRF